MNSQRHKVLSSKVIYQGKSLTILRDEVKSPKTGHLSEREYVDHPGASLIIPILPDGKILMEKQYRHAVGKSFLEFPAGKLDPGESALQAAERELLEETGYEASEWSRLGVIHPCIGYSNEFIEIFMAQGLEFRGAKLDPGEELETFSITPEDLHEKILMGEVTDGKTLCAYLWLKEAAPHRGAAE